MRVFPVILVAEGDFLTHEMQHNAVGRLFASHFGHPVDIVHTDSGAPYIPEFDGFISVSHCATAVAAKSPLVSFSYFMSLSTSFYNISQNMY